MNQNKKKLCKDIKQIIDESIVELIDRFLTVPTLFLEEKHLHNEFDKIVKEKINKNCFKSDSRIIEIDKKSNILFTKTKDNQKFPILMNEYATVNRYLRKNKFKTKLNNEKRSHTGSLDYVLLNPKWVNKNDYITCVNKDEKLRKKARKNEKENKVVNRFLIAIEFKYAHLDKQIKTADENRHALTDSSINSCYNKVIDEIKTDCNKLINEGAIYNHMVYFNSEKPLKKTGKDFEQKTSIKKLKEDINNVYKNYCENLKIWYVQAGIETRFKENDKYPIENIEPIFNNENT